MPDVGCRFRNDNYIRMAYYSGAQLGATEALPTTSGMLLLAIGWGVMTPLLVWLARACSKEI